MTESLEERVAMLKSQIEELEKDIPEKIKEDEGKTWKEVTLLIPSSYYDYLDQKDVDIDDEICYLIRKDMEGERNAKVDVPKVQ